MYNNVTRHSAYFPTKNSRSKHSLHKGTLRNIVKSFLTENDVQETSKEIICCHDRDLGQESVQHFDLRLGQENVQHVQVTSPSIQQQESEEEQQHRETSLGSSGEKQEPGDSITLKNILQERCLHHTSESAHGDSAQDEHDR